MVHQLLHNIATVMNRMVLDVINGENSSGTDSGSLFEDELPVTSAPSPVLAMQLCHRSSARHDAPVILPFSPFAYDLKSVVHDQVQPRLRKFTPASWCTKLEPHEKRFSKNLLER